MYRLYHWLFMVSGLAGADYGLQIRQPLHYDNSRRNPRIYAVRLEREYLHSRRHSSLDAGKAVFHHRAFLRFHSQGMSSV